MAELAQEFDLMHFEITTQTIERTLIDKDFVICDYYLSDKAERHSSRLYDIYKVLEYTAPDASLSKLVQEVRNLREHLPVCLPKQSYVSMTFWQKLWKKKYIGITMKRLPARSYLHIFLTKQSLVG